MVAAVLLHYPRSQTSETTIEPRRRLGTGQWQKCACLVQVQSQHHTRTKKWAMAAHAYISALKETEAGGLLWMK